MPSFYFSLSHSFLTFSHPPLTLTMATHRPGHVSPSRLADAGAAGVREAGARAGTGDDSESGGGPPRLTWDELLQYR